MVCAGAGGDVCSHIKPKTHKTAGGKVIVEEALLNILVVKMMRPSQDECVMMASNTFSSE